jgi:hypothetical protein
LTPEHCQRRRAEFSKSKHQKRKRKRKRKRPLLNGKRKEEINSCPALDNFPIAGSVLEL